MAQSTRPDSDPASAGTSTAGRQGSSSTAQTRGHTSTHTTSSFYRSANAASHSSASSLPTTILRDTSGPSDRLSHSATAAIPESSSSIQWGPATSVSSLRSAHSTGMPEAARSGTSAGFSDGSKKAVIAVTTIGGTLILAFLIYALWRRRKGASYSEIVRFQRHSGTIVLGSPQDARLTALPIYRESRYSVRSSNHGSTASFGKHALRRPSGVPPAVAQRFYQDNPWTKDVRKSGGVPLSPHPLSQVTALSPPAELKVPEMARVYSRQGSTERLPANDASKPGPSTSVDPVAVAKEDEVAEPRTPKEDPDRWSWTNSQAPPTPVMYAPSLHSSLSSLPRFRKVKSWVRNQTDRHAARIDEERGMGHSRQASSTMPILKNKASKPNLAPKPTRKLSKKSAMRDHSESPSVRYDAGGVGSSGPSRPSTAKVRDPRA